MIRTAAAFATITLTWLASPPLAVAEGSQVPPRSISVTGAATVHVVPDEVVFTVGVEAVNPKLDAVRSEVAAAVQKAQAVAKDLGIEPVDVQTDQIRLQPEYDSYAQQTRDKPRRLIAYSATTRLSITLRDVSKADELLAKLLKAGVNTINDVDFRTTKLRARRDEARKLAIHAAREKAELLAAELGQKIGRPLTISEEPTPGYYPRGWYGAATQVQVNASARSEEGPPADEGGTVALGQIGVTASVSVTFELE
jgi:uncharacterized protein YggE